MKRDHDTMADWDGGEDLNDTNDNEDSDDGVDTSVIPPYDAKQEMLPDSPVFTPEFAKLTQDIKDLVQTLRGPLEESGYSDRVVEGLLQEIENRTQSNYPEEVKIALIGDMRAGKSSVINSVLSTGMIARQGDSGGSCTWVVSEYGGLLPWQNKLYAAEVEFFPQHERHTIIAGLLADYYRASPKDIDPCDGPKDVDQGIEDHAIMKTTTTAFRAIFNEHKEFATISATHDFLATAQSEDDEAILETLCDWADDLFNKSIGGDTGVRAQSSTAQNLLWDLAPYMYTLEERDGEPIVSLWPFVSHIKFGLDNELLKRNISILDMPGLSDSDKTRVKNAVNHMRRCTHYMIIADVSRCKDDKFIREHLAKGYTTRGPNRTILVLTHADTIDDASEVSGTSKDFQALDRLRAEMKVLDKKRMEIAAKIKAAKGLEKYEYMEAKDAVSLQIRQKRAKHEEQRIGMRSRSVMKEMQSLYRELTDDPFPLAIFAVGNLAYKKHQAGYSLEDPNPPSLSVEGTMIPALRQHLLMAPAEAKMNETRHMVDTQLSALISCFNLYVRKTHMARKGEVQKIVTAPRTAVVGLIEKALVNLNKAHEVAILEPLREMEDNWVEEARILCKAWAKMYSTGQHLQFLKREGIKAGKGKGASGISWNSESISLASGESRQMFSDFIQVIDQIPKEITRGINGMVNQMIHGIRSDPQVTLMALQPFLDYLYIEKGNISPTVTKHMRTLRRETGMIQMHVQSESSDNEIVQAMVPVYAEAREIKGRFGKPPARLLNFEKNVTKRGEGVWARAQDMLRAELEEMTAKQMRELKIAVRIFFKDIEEKFNILCSDKETEEEAEVQLRETLGNVLVVAKEKLENELRPAALLLFGQGEAAE
ncbi:hypothetical protein LTR22_014196 [Elasticomyces elasticus]|nr:hypothetical protein LTR22_014196 [Elasticomyces elasticus]KAK4922856.1 hypothetical protein LTR49_009863 [Elasticomyces elasticus]KAK5759768.1 hypothetical protein LTS12_010108 [Elasticomyces elasticus]